MKCMPRCHKLTLEATPYQRDGQVDVRLRCCYCGRIEWTTYQDCYRRAIPVREFKERTSEEKQRKVWRRAKKARQTRQLSLFAFAKG